MIVEHGLTIGTNLFGTTFYSLVGLHAFHVTIGVVMLTLLCVFAWSGARCSSEHAERAELVSWYWHFVDGVWIVVLTVVYMSVDEMSAERCTSPGASARRRSSCPRRPCGRWSWPSA